ncbi:unnamed protein product [Agarophyton chilense]
MMGLSRTCHYNSRPFCDDLSLLRSLLWVPPFPTLVSQSGLRSPGYTFKRKGGKAFIEIELPGVEKEDIHVETRGHTLIVRAKRYSHDVKDKEKTEPRATYSFKARVSEKVDMDGIKAAFPGLGVLRLFIPYKATAAEKVRSVPIDS